MLIAKNEISLHIHIIYITDTTILYSFLNTAKMRIRPRNPGLQTFKDCLSYSTQRVEGSRRNSWQLHVALEKRDI